jgi:hypothetical protein
VQPHPSRLSLQVEPQLLKRLGEVGSLLDQQ